MRTEKLMPAHLSRLYKPVGKIVIQWALTDSTLHHLAFAMFKKQGTTPKVEKWEKMFGPRLRLLETMFQRPMFMSFANEAKEIFADVRHVQDLRDYLVHGTAVRYVPERDAIVFERIDKATKDEIRANPEQTHTLSKLLVSFSELAVASDICFDINSKLLNLHAAVKSLKAP